ncbi:hypothetical protein OG320_24485 [Microbispora sp. NBC_01189]|uniref:hypothetical protein n=1 Tax=Microbispora sp. NBC_01189 TaxID=2903583 RepID=UPI002E0D60C8|nr:hypothetical protein OG320_24485 [Microbispora sp. NBC_01189]
MPTASVGHLTPREVLDAELLEAGADAAPDLLAYPLVHSATRDPAADGRDRLYRALTWAFVTIGYREPTL